MLKLATLIENPGEPPLATRYHDPHELRGLGYNALVLYETTALSGVGSPEAVVSPEMRRWVEATFDAVATRTREAAAAGLAVYLAYDALVLARDAVMSAGGDELTCRGGTDSLCPASDAALDASVAAMVAMLDRLPEAAGVVLRWGDHDADRFPHLMGNDLYAPHCSRCGSMGRADRIIRLLQRFHEAVVERRGRRLIARAWNVRPGGLHDTPELAARVAPRLPGEEADDRFVLSFKFTQTDFWRWQPWNASSLMFGRRPIVYELECQREYEGKGGIPNWQAPLWRDGESGAGGEGDVKGLAAAAERVNLAGVWAWVRGGGWGGPFVKNEAWIDVNVHAAPRLAEDPTANVEDMARAWCRDRLGLTSEAAVEAVVATLAHSVDAVRGAFYIGPYARSRTDAWRPAADWVQDDLLDAEAAWRMVRRLNDAGMDEAVAEKRAAAEAWGRDRTALQRLLSGPDAKVLEPLVNTLLYAESLAEAMRDLVDGLVMYRRWQRSRAPDHANPARRKLLHAQAAWNHHTQRCGSLPGTATSFRETGFWEVTQRVLGELL